MKNCLICKIETTYKLKKVTERLQSIPKEDIEGLPGLGQMDLTIMSGNKLIPELELDNVTILHLNILDIFNIKYKAILDGNPTDINPIDLFPYDKTKPLILAEVTEFPLDAYDDIHDIISAENDIKKKLNTESNISSREDLLKVGNTSGTLKFGTDNDLNND